MGYNLKMTKLKPLPKLKPLDKVSIWGRRDPDENPEVLSVQQNGVWVMWKAHNLIGKIVIMKARYPAHALNKITE